MLGQTASDRSGAFSDTQEPAPSPVLRQAQEAVAAGISVLPTRDGEKRPALPKWETYQDRRATVQELDAWFTPRQQGLGIVLGRVSGNLEALDFDRNEGFVTFCAIMRGIGYGPLLDRLVAGYQERSPNGVHLLWRCETIAGNLKLALTYDRDEHGEVKHAPNGKRLTKTLAETRGEGGFLVIAPSHGCTHPSGKAYVLDSGSLSTIVTISAEERATIFDVARSLNEVRRETTRDEHAQAGHTKNSGTRPGDLFNVRARWEDILEPHGWVKVYEHTGKIYWRRPGKDRGVSATTNHAGSELLYVFSTSTEFESERGYSKFSAFTLLNHASDFGKAAEALLAQGYYPHDEDPSPHGNGHAEGTSEDVEESGFDDVSLAFPELAWREVFSRYREAMAGTTEASDVYHFVALWSAAAVRLRRKVFFPYGMALYPNVDLAIFGPTGDRKTTAARGSIKLLDTTNTKILQGSGSGEGLADWLNTESNTKFSSHYLYLEELSELLARGKWEGATLIPLLIRLFDCPDKYETTYRKNPIALVNPTLSILACTTPEVFWQYIKDLDVRSGFVNRFCFLTGEGKEPIALPKKPDLTKLESVLKSLRQLDALTSQEAHFSQEATELWCQFYTAWRKTKFDSLVKAATERIPSYIIKLAMVYAALEQTLPTISEEQVKAAIAVGWYATKCAERLMMQNRPGSAQARCEESIRRVLNETPHPLSRRRLWQRVSGRFDTWIFSKSIEGLVSTGEVKAQEGIRKGQMLYSIRPRRET